MSWIKKKIDTFLNFFYFFLFIDWMSTTRCIFRTLTIVKRIGKNAEFTQNNLFLASKSASFLKGWVRVSEEC